MSTSLPLLIFFSLSRFVTSILCGSIRSHNTSVRFTILLHSSTLFASHTSSCTPCTSPWVDRLFSLIIRILFTNDFSRRGLSQRLSYDRSFVWCFDHNFQIISQSLESMKVGAWMFSAWQTSGGSLLKDMKKTSFSQKLCKLFKF